MMGVQLDFYNRSNDKNNSKIVIFQKNVNPDFKELAVAWTVIENCGYGDHHPFYLPFGLSIDAKDSWGNYSKKLEAENGTLYELALDGSGNVLREAVDQTGASPVEVQLLNSLSSGAIDANCYKDGKLLASKTTIAPRQKAVFEFQPVIWIGVVSQVQEGEVMNSAIISSINTRFTLAGYKSASIVMTGGGPGADSKAFVFELDNIVAF